MRNEYHENLQQSPRTAASNAFEHMPFLLLKTMHRLTYLFSKILKQISRCHQRLQGFILTEKAVSPFPDKRFVDFDDLLAKIKSHNLGAFLSERGHLIQNRKMNCPICGSGTGRKKTPGFFIYDDARFICFSCQTQGDLVDFIMAVDDLDFKTAVLVAAHELGIPVPIKTDMHSPESFKIQVGRKLVFDQEKNSILEVPRYRYFHDHEAAEIFKRKRDLEQAEKLSVALASMVMVLAEHDEDIDLIVEVMGNDFEKRYFSMMKDKRWAFNKIIEWRNKNFQTNKKEKT